MRKKILAYNRVEKPVLERLQKKYDVQFFKNVDTNTDTEFLDFLQEAEGAIGLELPVDRQLLEHAPNLKIISNVSVGYNNLDLDALKEKNVMATNTPGVLTNTVADTAFGILVAAARRIPELDYYVKEGKWDVEAVGPELFGTNVHHKTLGIIGMGRIGNAIAQRGHFGFDMDILYHSRSSKPEAEKQFNAKYCNLDKLLEASDFVCMITPLTKQTEGMIGKEEFKRMKKSAIFVNASRGKTVVEEDLIEALKQGEIAAAALDVFEQEPIDSDNPLLQMSNVVTTPHIGSSTVETELKMSELAADNLEAGLNGEKPPNLIDASVWDNKG
ncbi:2-hydroxyacid dehydrogenase [Virgibacillus siamensis]|uniref:2-hydroxyacid dehydrogenase n=1 Tax=Virgibacillus siamensis TaxID=480071 RepID=UPI0009876332|nr:D-glycerate dehydrogenase [Virgibacillus siamensis]